MNSLANAGSSLASNGTPLAMFHVKPLAATAPGPCQRVRPTLLTDHARRGSAVAGPAFATEASLLRIQAR